MSIETNATDAQRIMELVAAGLSPDEAVAKVQAAQQRRRAVQVQEMEPIAGATIAPLNEKQFTQMVIYAFRSANHVVYHTHDSRKSEPGFPDIVAVHPERGVIFAELKMPRGVVSEVQQRWLDILRSAGARAYLWYPESWSTIEAVANGEK